ncbi:MAG: hypothetical protein COS14_05605, partial [Bacteroidetes bacterium CG02_land_8_20_14_3_00_31_25]
PSPIGEGVKKGKTQIIPVGSIIIFKAISVSFDFFEHILYSCLYLKIYHFLLSVICFNNIDYLCS